MASITVSWGSELPLTRFSERLGSGSRLLRPGLSGRVPGTCTVDRLSRNNSGIDGGVSFFCLCSSQRQMTSGRLTRPNPLCPLEISGWMGFITSDRNLLSAASLTGEIRVKDGGRVVRWSSPTALYPAFL